MIKGATTLPAHARFHIMSRYQITLDYSAMYTTNRMREEYYHGSWTRFYNDIASASQVQATSTTAPSGAEIQRKAVERFQLQIEIHRHKKYTIMVMYANTAVTANTVTYIVEARECT